MACGWPDVQWLAASSLTDSSLLLPALPLPPAELFDGVMRFNNILTDFDRDIWAYIR